jgi:TRAP-type C4-dicarboxylate transport system permease small subunit
VGLTLIYAGVNFMLIEMEMETVTPILKIPNSLLSGMLPFFGLVLGLHSIGEVHKLWAKPRQEDR